MRGEVRIGTIETAFFEPNPNDRVRILLEYKGAWKALFWIKLAKDGSVYLGPRITNPKTIKSGKSVSDSKGNIRINYSDGQEIRDFSKANKTKISFHASGVINSFKERQIRSSLRDIQKQEQLCSVFFQHPERFDTISVENLQKRDICLKYPIEENYPIFMHIFIVPICNFKIADMGTDIHQVNLVLQYRDISPIGEIAVQLSLFAPSKGSWPPYTYIIYPTKG